MIQQAVVLAAGLGERLRPLTQNCPKPMVEINGKPLLLYVLEDLQRAGITDVIIHVAYLGDYIIDAIADGRACGLNLNLIYAPSSEPIGTGGGIYLAKKFLTHPGKPFICVNSDIYTDYDYGLIAKLEINGIDKLGHLVLVKNPSENLKGDFDLNSAPAKSATGNPAAVNSANGNYSTLSRGAANNRPFTFSGIAAYHPSLIGVSQNPHQLADGLKYSIIEDIDANIDKFTASVHNGLWSDIGTLDRLQAMQRKISC